MRPWLVACASCVLSVPGLAAAQTVVQVQATQVQATPVQAGAQTAAPPPVLVAPYGARIVHHRVPYEPGMAIPPNGHLSHRPNVALTVAGSTVFVIGWTIASLLPFVDLSCTYDYVGSGSGCESASMLLVVPVIGPWLALGDSYTAEHYGGTVVAMGVVQAVGFAGLVAGLSMRRTYLVTDELYYSRRSNDLAVAPLVGRDVAGLAVGGTF